VQWRSNLTGGFTHGNKKGKQEIGTEVIREEVLQQEEFHPQGSFEEEVLLKKNLF
jgi:hypothetical protein